MKILYVTGLWIGFDEIVLNGAKPGSGLPSFWEPLNLHLEQGSEVRFITIEGSTINQGFDFGDTRFSTEHFIERVYYGGSLLNRLACARRLIRATELALKNDHYDFVYLHGPTAGICSQVARKFGIPVGQRLYGTFLWSDIKRFGKTACRIFRRNEFRSFLDPKCFLLVTNDGSGGDKAYEAITAGTSRYEFNHWMNGVDHNLLNRGSDLGAVAPKLGSPGKDFLFYCARFDRWKRQDLVVQVLAKLVKQGHDISLIFAGADSGIYEEYANEVKNLARSLQIDDRIIFLGHISREQTLNYHNAAIASPFLYDVCNLGNSLHEAIAAGGAVVARRDETMEAYIDEGENGCLCNDHEEAVSVIIALLADPERRQRLRDTSKVWAENNLLSWRERSENEIELISECVKQSKEAQLAGP